MKRPLAIRQINQIDNHSFTIKWNDGIEQRFILADIQAQCPCAKCVEEMSGKRIVDPHTIRKDVRAEVIRNVGRYGLRIQFTSGCSTGIYSFDMLRKLK